MGSAENAVGLHSERKHWTCFEEILSLFDDSTKLLGGAKTKKISPRRRRTGSGYRNSEFSEGWNLDPLDCKRTFISDWQRGAQERWSCAARATFLVKMNSERWEVRKSFHFYTRWSADRHRPESTSLCPEYMVDRAHMASGIIQLVLWERRERWKQWGWGSHLIRTRSTALRKKKLK